MTDNSVDNMFEVKNENKTFQAITQDNYKPAYLV